MVRDSWHATYTILLLHKAWDPIIAQTPQLVLGWTNRGKDMSKYVHLFCSENKTIWQSLGSVILMVTFVQTVRSGEKILHNIIIWNTTSDVQCHLNVTRNILSLPSITFVPNRPANIHNYNMYYVSKPCHLTTPTYRNR